MLSTDKRILSAVSNSLPDTSPVRKSMQVILHYMGSDSLSPPIFAISKERSEIESDKRVLFVAVDCLLHTPKTANALLDVGGECFVKAHAYFTAIAVARWSVPRNEEVLQHLDDIPALAQHYMKIGWECVIAARQCQTERATRVGLAYDYIFDNKKFRDGIKSFQLPTNSLESHDRLLQCIVACDAVANRDYEPIKSLVNILHSNATFGGKFNSPYPSMDFIRKMAETTESDYKDGVVIHTTHNPSISG